MSTTDEDWTTAYVDGLQIRNAKRAALDMYGQDFVEVQVDHTRSKLWVNSRHGCILRIYGMRGMFLFSDLRYRGSACRWMDRELRWNIRHDVPPANELTARMMRSIIAEDRKAALV